MNRNQIIDLLLYTEQKFPVYDWKYGDIDIWPICKEKIFFYLLNQDKTAISNIPDNSIFERVRYHYSNIIYFIKRNNKLINKNIIFAGAESHRVLFNDRYINRYFEPLKNKYTSYLNIEYNGVNRGLNYSEEILDIDRFLTLYRLKHYISRNDKIFYTPDLEHVEKVFSKYTDLNFNIKNISLPYCREVDLYASIFEDILKKTKTSSIYGLCYYSPAMFGLFYAANKLMIESYDVQHGGQGKIHAMYTYINFPTKGLNTLPKNFWVWDNISEDHLKTWIPEKGYHKVLKKGNPWIEYSLKNSNHIIYENDEIILYTLQSNQLSALILDTIKQTPAGYKWWLRLHPRMKDKSIIVNQLNSNNLINKVEIEKATTVTLPFLLSKCKIHISHTSGSIIEAESLGIKSIILGENGCRVYKEYIENGNSIGLPNPTVDELLNHIINLK